MRLSRLGNAVPDAALRSRPSQQPNRTRLPRIFYSSLRTTPISSLILPFRSHTLRQRQPAFPNSHVTRYSSRNTATPDPNREGLFYHLVEPPTPASRNQPAFALSFLASSPPRVDSSTTIGWLPATSMSSSSEGQEAGLNDFVENSKFRELLHEAVRKGLQREADDIQINGALQLQEGWMHIHDDRNIPPLGRIGDPDDIIGTVLVQNSKIMPQTYQAMPAYRLCTADGLTKLTPGLAQELQNHLAEVAETEKIQS